MVIIVQLQFKSKPASLQCALIHETRSYPHDDAVSTDEKDERDIDLVIGVK